MPGTTSGVSRNLAKRRLVDEEVQEEIVEALEEVVDLEPVTGSPEPPAPPVAEEE